MPIVKSTDTFIQRSLELLEVSPATTRISITYGSNKKESKVTKNKAENYVHFKLYDPVSGTLYKLKTSKVKDLSRVMTALGPHGVQITSSSKKTGEDVEMGDAAKATTAGTVQIRGFSSVLANTEIEEEVEEPKEEPKKEAGAKKGKKKKGKR